MDELSKLQDELKQSVLTFEEKASGNKIDNKHLIKQFTALVKNDNINEELINFIIDSTDEINTRHFQFVEHTTKTIKEISEITHRDIEKLKKILGTTNTKTTTINTTTTISWYNIKNWTLSDFKTVIMLLAILFVSIGFILNANNKDFFRTIEAVATTVTDKNDKKE